MGCDHYNQAAWAMVHRELEQAGHPITGQTISTADSDNGQCFSSKAIRALASERDDLLLQADVLLTIIGSRKFTNPILIAAIDNAKAIVQRSNERVEKAAAR